MTPRRALLCLIAISAVLRLVWAGSVGLGHDEAYHYLFSVHRDWSYFDHPPMLALVESIGPALFGSTSPISLRFGFVLLFAGSTWLLYRLTARSFGDRAGLLAALAMNVSAYHTAAAGAFALPDGPLLFFWLLTLDRIDLALRSPTRLTPWLLVGLAWGGALLSKYHAVFLPVGLLVYLLITPTARRLLVRPGPYLATIVGVAIFSPVLWWNSQHRWASFVFQGGRAVAKAGFKPLSLLGSIAGQAAYLLPWIWFALLIVLVAGLRRVWRREASEPERFLLCQSVTPLLLFSAVASVRDILPHWTLVGYLSAYPLLGRLWAEQLSVDPVRFRRRLTFAAVVPVVVAGFMVAQYRWGIVPVDRFVTRAVDAVRADPTAELYGWEQVAAELKRRGLLDDPGTFLFTSMWYQSGHIGYATRDANVPVVCYNPNDARSFAFWSRPGEWVGRDGVLVTFNDPTIEPDCYTRFFDRIESAGEFPIVREGKTLRTVRFYRCHRQLMAFPFEYETGPRRTALERVAAGNATLR
jgi:4-amino-4-deoxy-L-arabinose transferase-like glycosyltransferase